MPQASDELRAEMKRRFGDPIDSHGPEKFLLDAGYTTQDGLIKPKLGLKNLRDMPREEFECALFLCHEWDYSIDYYSAREAEINGAEIGDFRKQS